MCVVGFCMNRLVLAFLVLAHWTRSGHSNRNGDEDVGDDLATDTIKENRSQSASKPLLIFHNKKRRLNVPDAMDLAREVHDHTFIPEAVDTDASGVDKNSRSQAEQYTDNRMSTYLRDVATTSQQDADNRTFREVVRDVLMNIGGGTGATIGGTHLVAIDQDLLRRMRIQDKAVMLLLLLAYTGSLAFSASLVYRQASNDSPVVYYADPRFHNMAVDNDDVDGFLEAFNQTPKDVHLQVTGLVPLPPLVPESSSVFDNSIEWLGYRYQVEFSFALDLSPWIVRCESEGILQSEAAHGIPPADLQRLAEFLAYNKNDLAVLQLDKEVSWENWEELAMNIKHYIRQKGFRGVTCVTRSGEESVKVHKNRPWANFMHSRTTTVLCALSVFGWLIYQPYMCIRNRTTKIRCRFQVDVAIADYWSLISEQIGSRGFGNEPLVA